MGSLEVVVVGGRSAQLPWCVFLQDKASEEAIEC